MSGALGGVAHTPGLPEVSALVCRDYVESRGQAEPKAGNERIREANPGEIDLREPSKKRQDVGLRGEEMSGCVGQRRCRPWPNLPRRFHLEPWPDGRLERAHEPVSDQPRPCGTAPPASSSERALTHRLHRLQVDA